MRITRGGLSISHGLLSSLGGGMDRRKSTDGIVLELAEGRNIQCRMEALSVDDGGGADQGGGTVSRLRGQKPAPKIASLASRQDQ